MAKRKLTIPEIGKRVKEYLIEIGVSQTEAAEKLGVKQAAVSNQLNGRKFGINAAERWNAAFGLRLRWLMTGEGPMLDSDEDKEETDDSIFNIEEHPELIHNTSIPVIPSKLFRMPHINIYDYVTQSDNVERVPPIPHFQKHDVFATCPGDAMAPKICRGYILALRKLPDNHSIVNGEIYVVDTKSQGMFIRRLIDNGHGLTFVAENQTDFPNFELPYDEVYTYYRVVGAIIPNLV